MNRLKNAWKSVTIWFNGILLAALPFTDYLKEQLPQLSQYIDGAAFKNIATAIIVINIALRFKTTKCLSAK